MLLYKDPWFMFRFAEDRIIPRFHLEGLEAGRRVSVGHSPQGIWLFMVTVI